MCARIPGGIRWGAYPIPGVLTPLVEIGQLRVAGNMGTEIWGQTRMFISFYDFRSCSLVDFRPCADAALDFP